MKSRKPIRKKNTSRVKKTSRPSKAKVSATRKAKPKKPAARKPRAKRAARKTKLVIPPILLEGDREPISKASGSGERYSLGPNAPAGHFEMPSVLPESYGTKKLLLMARDPHWLYAHWDLSNEQLRKLNSLSADGHLIIRVHKESLQGKVATEAHVHPESRHWFVNVRRAATKYVAELGYRQRNGKWKRISISEAALTPPASVSTETTVEFATLPFDVPLKTLAEIVKSAAGKNRSLARDIEKLRADGHPALPRAAAFASGTLTPAQERALTEAVSVDKIRRVWIGSLEVTELVRGKLFSDMTSLSLSSWS